MSPRLAEQSHHPAVAGGCRCRGRFGQRLSAPVVGPRRPRGDGELGTADFLAAEQVAHRLDGRRAGSRGWVQSEVSWLAPYRLLTFSSPCCWRMAVRLVLATSSAKALSRKTTVSRPSGQVACARRRCRAPALDFSRLHSADKADEQGARRRCCGQACRQSSSLQWAPSDRGRA